MHVGPWACGAVFLSVELLGGAVRRGERAESAARARLDPRCRFPLLHGLGDAEVEHLEREPLAPLDDQEVFRFQVPMSDVELVGDGEGFEGPPRSKTILPSRMGKRNAEGERTWPVMPP